MGVHAAGRREQLFLRKQLMLHMHGRKLRARGTRSYRTQVKLQLLFLCRPLLVRRARSRSQGRRPNDLRSREKSMLCAEYFSSRFGRRASLAELVALAKQGAVGRGAASADNAIGARQATVDISAID